MTLVEVLNSTKPANPTPDQRVMGKVMNRVRLTNHTDFDLAERGTLDRPAIRSVEIDALVDTGPPSSPFLRTWPASWASEPPDRPARLADGRVVRCSSESPVFGSRSSVET